jgi:hypothetical protein
VRPCFVSSNRYVHFSFQWRLELVVVVARPSLLHLAIVSENPFFNQTQAPASLWRSAV